MMICAFVVRVNGRCFAGRPYGVYEADPIPELM